MDRKIQTLIATILGSSIVFIDGSVVNVALPALARDLDAGLAAQQWIVEAYLLMLGSLVLVGGSLGDLYGRRRIFSLGVAGFGITSLLCAVAPSAETLVGARAIGLWTAWTSAAIAVGPPLGGVLIDAISWRAVFAINIPLVLACLWLTRRAMTPCHTSGAQRVDVVGGVLTAAGLAGPVYALIRQPDVGWGSPEVLVPLLGGFALLGVFVAWEHHHPEPMLPLDIFRSRNFAVGNVVTLAVYAGLSAATFFIAIFLQQVAGYDAVEAGLALTPITLLMIGLAGRFGALSTRIGPRALMGFGPIVAGAGLLLFLRADADADYLTQVLPAVLVFGLGLAMTVAPLTATVLAAADIHHAGIASGVNNAVARVAGLVGIAVVGVVIAGRSDAGLTADDKASSLAAFHWGLGVAGGLVIAGGLIALAGIENRRHAVAVSEQEAAAAA